MMPEASQVKRAQAWNPMVPIPAEKKMRLIPGGIMSYKAPMRFLPLLIALVLSGCAVGNKYDYKSVRAPIPKTAGKNSIAVATVDRREYLINAEVADNYVGMTRDGFGIPFRVSTKSKAPLSTDLSDAVAASLTDAGYQAKAISGFSVSNTSAAKSKLLATPARRHILVTINKWESDTLVNTQLTTDFTVEVFDANGKLLASDSYTEVKDLCGDFWNPVIHARKTVLAETSRILAILFSSPKISRAL